LERSIETYKQRIVELESQLEAAQSKAQPDNLKTKEAYSRLLNS
jgi:predicted RNase H-like nuclease (RuvC/YqgF family)